MVPENEHLARERIATKTSLLIVQPRSTCGNKITIVGAGQVGLACAYSTLNQNVSIVFIRLTRRKTRSEEKFWTFSTARHFCGEPKSTAEKVRACCFRLMSSESLGAPDYALSSGSKICIVTAGARQKEGESRLNLVQRNTSIFKEIIPELVRYSSDNSYLATQWTS
ncbi:hypothetical protein RUM44_009346 [Polyplax serrata]|uniref:Lactate/malate dehydrogenase N-terminal domain-containing protein n=1 Tax=Polyplax serrata TaxID=468196 RepID=A0ABR1ASF1_POLSC